MTIGVIDTNVLIDLFDNPKYSSAEYKDKVIKLFKSMEINMIWIPQEVKREFSITPAKEKRLNKILTTNFFKLCPVKVNKKERKFYATDIDDGEADAIVQINKSPQYSNYSRYRFIFISKDKEACRYAQDKMEIEVMPEEKIIELQVQMRL